MVSRLDGIGHGKPKAANTPCSISPAIVTPSLIKPSLYLSRIPFENAWPQATCYGQLNRYEQEDEFQKSMVLHGKNQLGKDLPGMVQTL